MALPEKPLSRNEQYLNRIATGTGEIPEIPLSRIEQYLDVIAENTAGTTADIEALKASVSEILRSMADPYDPAHTYTAGQLIMYDGRLYRALVDITTPEAWTPEHWQAVDLEDEITQLREELAQKYSKPADGIPKTDLDSDVQESLGKADSALQEHQSLAAYRTASEQNVIDAQKYSASNPPPYPVTSVNGQTGGVVLNYITYDEEEE